MYILLPVPKQFIFGTIRGTLFLSFVNLIPYCLVYTNGDFITLTLNIMFFRKKGGNERISK